MSHKTAGSADRLLPDEREPGDPVVPLLVTPRQAATMLAVGRTAVYALMGSGRLPFVLLGSSRRLPVEGLRTFVRDEMARQGFVQ